ncbi:MAG TPA: TonB-dependent receptor plug domain-containing protein [Gemmatimonadaceae bacterium]|nr:TonB-dependent receptor plug domain-containing protein [Gemmatimonadaceae bacterium]
MAERSAVAIIVAVGTLACGPSTPPPSEPAPAADGAMGRSLQSEGTSAVSVVDAEDLEGRPALQIEELIEGKAAGVEVIRHASGGFSFRIRGPASFLGSYEPLYVIDGMPVHVQPGQGLNWLNPRDIERIEILKDASATAMYGVRGGNGVVLITTRHGKR